MQLVDSVALRPRVPLPLPRASVAPADRYEASPPQTPLVDPRALRDRVRPRPFANAELARYHASTRRDLETLVDFLEHEVRPPVAVFGSARLRGGTMDQMAAVAIGSSLAAARIPPITGGGPSVMTWVPESFVKHRRVDDGTRTQAAAIIVPHEPASKHDGVHAEFEEFLFRKLAIYHKAIGLLAMPGGFGTVDELFEVWAQAARRQHEGRLAAVRGDFWRPLLGVLREVAVERRPLITRSAWNRLEPSDAVSALVRSMPDPKIAARRENPRAMAARMGAELEAGLHALDGVAPAVTILGGRELAASDPTLRVLGDACVRLAAQGEPLRIGNPSVIGQVVVDAAAGREVQSLVMAGEGHAPGTKVLAEQHDFIVHKDLLTRHSKALVVLPGGLGTLSNLFAVLTEIQTGRRPRIPIVLVGSDFWQPIKDALKQGMLTTDRAMIAPHDLDLMTVTDDAETVARVVTAAACEVAAA